MFGVSEVALNRAAVVRDHAVPEVREAVRSEAVALSTGAAIARATPEVQSIGSIEPIVAPVARVRGGAWARP